MIELKKNMMSDQYCCVPFEMQSEIMKRVRDVRSLIRFRSVSKQWKSLIDSSEFITHHTLNRRRAGPYYLLVIGYVEDSDRKYVSIVDDDSFPRLKFSPVVAPAVKLLDHSYMLDCSHGLVYLRAYDADHNSSIVIWNPSIGKSVSIMLQRGPILVGVGVCPKTSDPKIVKITPCVSGDGWKAGVFSLSTGEWRSVSNKLHLSQSLWFESNQVVIDGVIHWLAHDQPNRPWDLIVSFDLVSEEFKEVALPNSLAPGDLMTICKLNESLVVLHFGSSSDTYDAWMMMENGGFVKLLTLGFTPQDGYQIYNVIGFRRNGQPIRQRPYGFDGSLVTKLEAYELSKYHRCDLGICFPYDSEGEPLVQMTSYTESLLLLNHPAAMFH